MHRCEAFAFRGPIILALRGAAWSSSAAAQSRNAKLAGYARRTPRSRSVLRPHPALDGLATTGAIVWVRRPFAAGDCAGALLVFAATGDPDVDAAVIDDAHAHGALADAVAAGERGDFHTPAVHRSGPLTVTVDSAGSAPAFTARIRDELALQFDARYARAATTLGALREQMLAVVPPERRAAVLRHFAERDIDELAAMQPAAIEHEVRTRRRRLGRRRAEARLRRCSPFRAPARWRWLKRAPSWPSSRPAASHRP